ncbi:putative nucleotidyltransferase substrate binding domain-containing protein, partial [Desulfuromonas sp.]|uniref:putative nucleotidyltransferase substrate binding domain-containing protein n=1 Tax=Desulfuromonas sp. TaxID=892 RepID=UPI003436E06C
MAGPCLELDHRSGAEEGHVLDHFLRFHALGGRAFALPGSARHCPCRTSQEFQFSVLHARKRPEAQTPCRSSGALHSGEGGEHKGLLSLKQAGSVFIVDCIRMFMLEKGFDATTTIERLAELVKLNV